MSTSTSATDTRGYILRSEAIRLTGLSKSELDALIAAGRVAVRAIPGTRTRVNLADVVTAARGSTVSSH